MFKILRNAWAIPELRKKMLYTLLVILIFRIGAALPVPFLDIATLKANVESLTNSNPGTLVSYLNVLSGGAFENATLFAMGVTPYINSSIILQLLTVAIPALERLSKEGEEGRRKIGQYTRYTTVILGLIQGTVFYIYLNNTRVVMNAGASALVKFYIAAVIVLTFTAGSAVIMWLGEQVNNKGVGNGISIILFAGIVSRAPQAIAQLVQYFKWGIKSHPGYDETGNIVIYDPQVKYLFFVPGIILLFLLAVAFIVFMDSAERRIPVQYAKRVVGRKMYGGQSTHIPIKVNMAGVLPIIFASSIMSIPGTIRLFTYGNQPDDGSFWYKVLSVFGKQNAVYCIVYFILIILFAYFYVTIQYNPIEMANNLRKNAGTIPGIRPGQKTSEYIARIISRITLIGALFLSVIAILPIILAGIAKVNIGMSGTSIIIMVGVALETVRAIESQMLMRHYKGFLD